MDAIGAQPPGLRLRLLAAGSFNVAVTAGVLAFLLAQALQMPPPQPQKVAQRIDDTAMDWRPLPEVRIADVSPVAPTE